MPENQDKESAEVLKFLACGPVRVRQSTTCAQLLLDGGKRGTFAASAECLSGLARRGLIERQGALLAVNTEGTAAIRRMASAEPFQDQHRDLERVTIALPEGHGLATINLNESPLAQLARRRDKAGKTFLDDRELRAVERLRSDYTRGNIMPRLGANWTASVASAPRSIGSEAMELTDAALAARQRVSKAIAAVGPELSGVLIDICCFLKGVETVEAERRWPARSAKLMLKAALGVLSRHYEPVREGRPAPIGHWGVEGFRPAISD